MGKKRNKLTLKNRKMAKLKPLTYWLDLQKQYEKIIAETKDKEHKKVTKEALKIVKSKIKEYEPTK